MKKLILPSLIAAGLITPLFSQEEETEVIDLEARKASIPTLEQYIKERRERLEEIHEDLRRLDARVEARVDKIVHKLSSLRDSENSKYRVNQIKMHAIDSLKGSIEDYQSRRTALIREAREKRTDIPEEVLTEDAAKFDKRIEKRVQQIMELSNSFTQGKDVQKHEKTGTTHYRGWSQDMVEISDEWKQNRRDRTMDKKQQNEIVDALKKSIDRHEKYVATFKDSLANRKMSDTDRRLMTAELARHEQLLQIRNNQLLDMVSSKQAKTSAISRDAAMDLEDALDDAASDLRRDIQSVFQQYTELNRERNKIYKMEKNLEARKKWIADYEAKMKTEGK